MFTVSNALLKSTKSICTYLLFSTYCLLQKNSRTYIFLSACTITSFVNQIFQDLMGSIQHNYCSIIFTMFLSFLYIEVLVPFSPSPMIFLSSFLFFLVSLSDRYSFCSCDVLIFYSLFSFFNICSQGFLKWSFHVFTIFESRNLFGVYHCLVLLT